MAINEAALSISFDGARQQFNQQIEFFRQKLNIPTERWDDVKARANDRAFYVAGAQKADLLADLRSAVDRSVRGQSIGEFRKDFADAVKKAGWGGWTGEGTQAGEAWRTRVIYQTNVATSYAAGRWQQLNDPDLAAARPFWRYVHSDSVLSPRPLHKAWGDSSLTLLREHPFWKTHFPPNGWFCQCRVVAVRSPKGGDAQQPPGGWDAIDPKTGAPVGIDKGWDYAPGASSNAQLRQTLIDKLSTLPADASKQIFAEVTAGLSQSVAAPKSLDDFILAGRVISDQLGEVRSAATAFQFHTNLMQYLKKEVGISTPAKLASTGFGAKLIQQASMAFPDSWTKKADQIGPLFVRSSAQARGYQYTETVNRPIKLANFGVIRDAQRGWGFIQVRAGSLGNAVHEYAHRLQAAMPELDDLFQQLHRRRTLNAPLKKLKDIHPASNYKSDELTREDGYRNAYQGREYVNVLKNPALEVMTMALEDVLGAAEKTPARLAALQQVYEKDREMLDFVVGLLKYWRP